MDRNSVIGLLLIGLILIGFSLWNQPSSEELATRKRVQDSLATVAAKAQAEQAAAREAASRAAIIPTADSLAVTDSAKATQLVNKFGVFSRFRRR